MLSSYLCCLGAYKSQWTMEAWQHSRIISSTVSTVSPASSPCSPTSRTGRLGSLSSHSATVWDMRYCSSSYRVQVRNVIFSSLPALTFYSRIAGQPALYPFLDFNNNLGLAVIIVLISSILIPLIHLALCWLSEHIGKHTDKTKNKN